MRRRHVQTHDVPDLLDELRVVGQLEASNDVALEAVRAPDSTHGHGADSRLFGHFPRAPMGSTFGCFFERANDDLLDLFVGNVPRPSNTRLIVQAIKPILDEPSSPFSNGMRRRPEAVGHRLVTSLRDRSQDELRAEG